MYLPFLVSLGAQLFYTCMKMSFHSHADKTHFHMKGFAPGLAFKHRHKTIRKWPVLCIFRLIKQVTHWVWPGSNLTSGFVGFLWSLCSFIWLHNLWCTKDFRSWLPTIHLYLLSQSTCTVYVPATVLVILSSSNTKFMLICRVGREGWVVGCEWGLRKFSEQ